MRWLRETSSCKVFLFQQAARTTHQLKLLKICGTDENIKRAKELVDNLLAANTGNSSENITENNQENDPENKPQTTPENNFGKDSPNTVDNPDLDKNKITENLQNVSGNTAVTSDVVGKESNTSSGNDSIETNVTTACNTDENPSESAVKNSNEANTGTETRNDNTTTTSITTDTSITANTIINTNTTATTNNNETIEEVILVAKASIGSVIGKGGQFIKKVFHQKLKLCFF